MTKTEELDLRYLAEQLRDILVGEHPDEATEPCEANESDCGSSFCCQYGCVRFKVEMAHSIVGEIDSL